MKATLEFDLPEENDEFKDANDGWKYRMVIEKLDSNLRTVAKYGNIPDKLLKFDKESIVEFADFLRSELRNIAYEEGTKIDF